MKKMKKRCFRLREKLKPLLQKKCSEEEIKRNMGFPLEKIIDFIVGKNL